MPGESARRNGRLGGRPKGHHTKWTSTLQKEAARELVRQFVQERMGDMLEAQARHAIGLTHLMLRHEDGTWSKAPESLSSDQLLAILNGDQTRYYLAIKDPSTQAFTDLMNRALDKPKEQAQDINLNVSSDLAKRIAEGRARAAARNKKG